MNISDVISLYRTFSSPLYLEVNNSPIMPCNKHYYYEISQHSSFLGHFYLNDTFIYLNSAYYRLIIYHYLFQTSFITNYNHTWHNQLINKDILVDFSILDNQYELSFYMRKSKFSYIDESMEKIESILTQFRVNIDINIIKSITSLHELRNN